MEEGLWMEEELLMGGREGRYWVVLRLRGQLAKIRLQHNNHNAKGILIGRRRCQILWTRMQERAYRHEGSFESGSRTTCSFLCCNKPITFSHSRDFWAMVKLAAVEVSVLEVKAAEIWGDSFCTCHKLTLDRSGYQRMIEQMLRIWIFLN
jgi:hypothetical protein